MAVKLPFMPFYGADFFADEKVQLMSGQEVASYLRLLWHQWREGSVPGNPEDCSAIARASHDPERVLACFPVGADGRRRNPRLEVIRAEQEIVRQKKSEGGKLGRARQIGQGDPGESLGSARGKPKESLASQSQSQIQITDTETTKSIVAAHAASSQNGKAKHTKPSRAPPVLPNWVNDAVEIYAAHIGMVPHGKAGKLLKPLVDRRGWTEVKPVLEYFCEFAPYEDYLTRMEAGTLRAGEEKVKKLGYNTSLAAFAEHYTHYAKLVAA